MTQFGSNSGIAQQTNAGIVDAAGNIVVSSDNSFGASPLGVAARTQALYGIPNANFNLTPPEPDEEIIANSNDLPFWSIDNQSDGRITATSVFNTDAQTWSVRINPLEGLAGDSVALTTRSYLLNDTNVNLLQKAYANLEKVGTYTASNEWNAVLSASYYDATGSALSTYDIGTVADNGTWTGISGFTTSGTTAVNAAAQYVDLALTLTIAADVTDNAEIDFNSLLLQTSVAGGGGGGSQSFVLATTYTSSTTWTRPTGVESLIAVVAAGGGGGGGGGALEVQSYGNASMMGGGGGASGNFSYLQNLQIGTVATISIGVGTAGVGGTARSLTKAAGSSDPARDTFAGAAGGAGGATTFGTYFTVNGGGGGSGGSISNTTVAAGTTVAGTLTFYPGTIFTAGNGGAGGFTGSTGGASGAATLSSIAYAATATAGGSGGAGSVSGGTARGTTLGGNANGTAGWLGGGGGGGGVSGTASTAFPTVTGNTGGAAGGARGAGGGGGGVASVKGSVAGTYIASAGNGGSGGANVGGGGGGGGAAMIQISTFGNYNSSQVAGTAGAGGNGSTGFVTVVYVG